MMGTADRATHRPARTPQTHSDDGDRDKAARSLDATRAIGFILAALLALATPSSAATIRGYMVAPSYREIDPRLSRIGLGPQWPGQPDYGNAMHCGEFGGAAVYVQFAGESWTRQLWQRVKLGPTFGPGDTLDFEFDSSGREVAHLYAAFSDTGDVRHKQFPRWGVYSLPVTWVAP